jgi:hypothetical protein
VKKLRSMKGVSPLSLVADGSASACAARRGGGRNAQAVSERVQADGRPTRRLRPTYFLLPLALPPHRPPPTHPPPPPPNPPPPPPGCPLTRAPKVYERVELLDGGQPPVVEAAHVDLGALQQGVLDGQLVTGVREGAGRGAGPGRRRKDGVWWRVSGAMRDACGREDWGRGGHSKAQRPPPRRSRGRDGAVAVGVCLGHPRQPRRRGRDRQAVGALGEARLDAGDVGVLCLWGEVGFWQACSRAELGARAGRMGLHFTPLGKPRRRPFQQSGSAAAPDRAHPLPACPHLAGEALGAAVHGGLCVVALGLHGVDDGVGGGGGDWGDGAAGGGGVGCVEGQEAGGAWGEGQGQGAVLRAAHLRTP